MYALSVWMNQIFSRLYTLVRFLIGGVPVSRLAINQSLGSSEYLISSCWFHNYSLAAFKET
jgi:hypothetical protein